MDLGEEVDAVTVEAMRRRVPEHAYQRSLRPEVFWSALRQQVQITPVAEPAAADPARIAARPKVQVPRSRLAVGPGAGAPVEPTAAAGPAAAEGDRMAVDWDAAVHPRPRLEAPGSSSTW
jgi:hypothetical protein